MPPITSAGLSHCLKIPAWYANNASPCSFGIKRSRCFVPYTRCTRFLTRDWDTFSNSFVPPFQGLTLFGRVIQGVALGWFVAALRADMITTKMTDQCLFIFSNQLAVKPKAA